VICKDQGRYIDVFRIADGLGYLELPATALPSFQNMAEGEMRTQSATRGTIQETSIAAIIQGAIENPVYDPAILQSMVTRCLSHR